MKYPYRAHDIATLQACKIPDICCTVNDTTEALKFIDKHAHYCQIQGQMAIVFDLPIGLCT